MAKDGTPASSGGIPGLNETLGKLDPVPGTTRGNAYGPGRVTSGNADGPFHSCVR
jgi:hypothetical protein